MPVKFLLRYIEAPRDDVQGSGDWPTEDRPDCLNSGAGKGGGKHPCQFRGCRERRGGEGGGTGDETERIAENPRAANTSREQRRSSGPK